MTTRDYRHVVAMPLWSFVVPLAVGTGLWIAGGNDNFIRNNRFYDNWRRGTMLFAVPDQLVCGPRASIPNSWQAANPDSVPPSTSYRNQFYGKRYGPCTNGAVLPNGTGDVTSTRTRPPSSVIDARRQTL